MGLTTLISVMTSIGSFPEKSDLRRYNTEHDKAETGREAFLEWDGDNDPDNPFNWPKARKWAIMLTVCTGTFLAAVNATAYTAVAIEIAEEFGVHDTASFPASFWPVTAWNAGAALVPTILLPFGENFGMKWTYLSTYVLFFVFVIPQAVAKSFATLVVTRFISGCLGGTILNCIGGIIADIWVDEEQQNLPMTLFVFALVFGVTIAPVIGGAIALQFSWRWYVSPSSARMSLVQMAEFCGQGFLRAAYRLRRVLPGRSPCDQRD